MALLADFRIAARALAKNKAWTAVALLALTLGLGANIAIYSVVGLMIQVPLPYPDPGQLVHIPQTNPQRGFRQSSVSLPDVLDWKTAPAIQSIAAYRTRPMAFTGAGEPQQLPAMQVTPEFFPTLGIQPALGRTLAPNETPESDARAAILSYELWQGMFRGESSVLGREIRLDGGNYTIVGVMPQGFHFLYRKCDVWVPLSLEPAQRERGWRGLGSVARLSPGVTREVAAAQVRAISERVEREDRKNGEHWRGEVRPLADLVIPKGARASAGAMFGAVGFVLLIACANVASLQLARGMMRRREFALRSSLGASRSSLIRLQLAESLLLSLAGGVIGVITCYWTVPLLKRVAPPQMDIFKLAHVDLGALGFALALSLVTGVVFGLAPAWLLSRGNLSDSLQDSSRGSTGGRHLVLKGLVVAEMTLALVLVSAGAMMIRSLIRQQTMDLGFDRTNVTGAQLMLPVARYAEPSDIAGFFTRTLENLERDGSVESAALVQTLPLAGSNTYTEVRVEGAAADPDRNPVAGYMVVSPAYFRTLRIPLIAGRDFNRQDHADSEPVAIVNEAFVRRYWPENPRPVGRRLRTGSTETAPWLTVVGIARDVRHVSLDDPPRPEVYRVYTQAPERSVMLLARSRRDGQNTANVLRSSIWQVDRDQPIFRLVTLDAYFLTRNEGQRATTKVLSGLAFIALALAAIGIYGVVAYGAAQRIREIGIRLALGASAESIFRAVLKGALALAGVGLAIGLPAAYGVTPLLRTVSEGLQPHETTVYAGVAVLLFLITVAASLAPAIRAMRVDPARVLRDE